MAGVERLAATGDDERPGANGDNERSGATGDDERSGAGATGDDERLGAPTQNPGTLEVNALRQEPLEKH